MSKIAFITGVTSGIGEAAAEKFLLGGWKVIGTGRRRERLDAFASKFSSDKFFPLVFDVRDVASIEELISSIPGDKKNIDLLINNAGLALGTSAAQSSSLKQWQQMIETNEANNDGVQRREGVELRVLLRCVDVYFYRLTLYHYYSAAYLLHLPL